MDVDEAVGMIRQYVEGRPRAYGKASDLMSLWCDTDPELLRNVIDRLKLLSDAGELTEAYYQTLVVKYS